MKDTEIKKLIQEEIKRQKRVSSMYKMLAKRDPVSWKVVDCMSGKKLMSREDIANDVFLALSHFF
jgi:uncharacterized protein YdbL (DUF1318 family)